MDGRSTAVHDAAAGAVDAWTKAALRSLLETKTSLQQSEADLKHEAHDAAVELTKACVVRGVTYATAATLSEAWIREGLAHSASGTALEIHTEDAVDCTEDVGCVEAPNDTQLVSLDTIQSLAYSVAADAVQCALDQVTAMLVDLVSLLTPSPDSLHDTAAPPTPRTVLSRAPSCESVPIQSADVDVADAKPASTDVVDDSEAYGLTRQHQAAVVEAASRYVSTLLDSAVVHRQHNASPAPPTCEAREPAAPLVVRTPTPPPEPKPVLRPHVEIVTQRLTTPEPVVELAAVRPPKTGARSRSKKPPPTLGSSPPPPKTAEAHFKAKGHRASSSKAPAEEEDPPRLRKLEEYLALHPVNRAKKIYRPQQPLRQQLPSLKPPHSPSGYDAETDGSDDEDLELELLQHKPRSLKKLRPTPTLPGATSPSKVKPPPVLKPVDRPERLGLLNKPKKRSGFCQQCTFEGRSCKISDCIKHQPLR